MRSEYYPESSFAEGKLKRPSSSLTTLIVTLEPAFFALTTTPSIAPSSAEVTRPVRATEACARRESGAGTRVAARTARLAETSGKRRARIGTSLPFSGLPPELRPVQVCAITKKLSIRAVSLPRSSDPGGASGRGPGIVGGSPVVLLG